MPRRHRNRITEHVLIAGCREDLVAIQHVLDLLPEGTFGRVLLEGIDRDEAASLVAPPRVTVSWLGASRGGEAAARAARAWAGEWLADDAGLFDDEQARPSFGIVWLGCADSAAMSTLRDELAHRVSSVNELSGLSPRLAG